uniref:Putative secreted protein n=1 Tax=Ixodes ricinus TaxID=34613 RepID=A0A6B0UAR8_IXORI
MQLTQSLFPLQMLQSFFWALLLSTRSASFVCSVSDIISGRRKLEGWRVWLQFSLSRKLTGERKAPTFLFVNIIFYFYDYNNLRSYEK